MAIYTYVYLNVEEFTSLVLVYILCMNVYPVYCECAVLKSIQVCIKEIILTTHSFRLRYVNLWKS